MKFARRGEVVQVGFFPFQLVTTVPFPSDYMLLVCNSGIHARKTVGAKDIFNHRVACYQIGRELFKQEFPAYADRITHLRDLTPTHLGVGYPDMLAMLARLPEQIDRDDISARLPGDFCARIFATHAANMRHYQVRSVVLYGLAEIARAQAAPTVLAHGHAVEFGQWMNRSHDGDRVVKWVGKEPTPFFAASDDAALATLAARARAGDPEASLVRQAGAYACSVPEIDQMVDIAISVNGVAGAQIAGAGLGGCIMVLVKQEATEYLASVLTSQYYDPRNLDADIYACCPTAGSGVLAI